MGIIFQHTLAWVLDTSPHTGQPKTLTSRPCLPMRDAARVNEAFRIQRIERLTPSGSYRLLWALGQERAALPARSFAGLGRISITGLQLSREAGELSLEDARAEGFATVEAFREVYGRIYGAEALRRPCWRIRFERVSALPCWREALQVFEAGELVPQALQRERFTRILTALPCATRP